MSKANFTHSLLTFLLLFSVAEWGFSFLGSSAIFQTGGSEQVSTSPVCGQQTAWANKMPLKDFWEILKSNIVIDTIIRLLLTLFCGLYLSRIAIRNMIFTGHTYTPLILFTIISTCTFGSSTQQLAVSAILITSLSALAKSFRHGISINNLLTAGFCFGMATIMYPPAALFFVTLFIILPILGRNLREYITTFTGFLLPIFFIAYIYWAVGEEFLYIPQSILSGIINITYTTSLIPKLDSVSDYAQALFFVLLILMIISALIIFTKRYKIYRERPRRTILVCWLYLVTCTAMLLVSSAEPQQLTLIAIPLSIILSIVVNQNTKLTNILYLSLVIYALIYNIVA